jgi:hypothetical protein
MLWPHVPESDAKFRTTVLLRMATTVNDWRGPEMALTGEQTENMLITIY